MKALVLSFVGTSVDAAPHLWPHVKFFNSTMKLTPQVVGVAACVSSVAPIISHDEMSLLKAAAGNLGTTGQRGDSGYVAFDSLACRSQNPEDSMRKWLQDDMSMQGAFDQGA